MNAGYQRAFATDPALSAHLFDLLESAFPGVTAVAESGRALGAAWEDISTPFLAFEDGKAVAHVGVLALPMVIMGEQVTVGGVHGVCSRPQYRGRGLVRRLMEDALAWCEGRYRTLVLCTEHPALFERFGFRVVQEHVFRAAREPLAGGRGFRILDPSLPKDRETLMRVLETRAPASDVVGVVRDQAVFCFNEGTRPLHYADDIDVLVSMEIAGARLKLYDVVAPRMCSLATILARVPHAIEEVWIGLSPDKLRVKDAEAVPHSIQGNAGLMDHVLGGQDLFMVRGPFAAEGKKFTVPRSARC